MLMRQKIKYTNHVIVRKFERDITDEEVQKTVDDPEYTMTSIEGKKIAVKVIGNRTIHVVYKESKTHINVITVY